MIEKPALLVTYLCDRQRRSAVDRLIAYLGRPATHGGLALQPHNEDDWRNEGDKTLLIRIRHPELSEVDILQLALNSADPTETDWSQLIGRLDRALQELPETVNEAVIGRTLVYEGVLTATADMDSAAREILAGGVLKRENGKRFRRYLAAQDVAGGRLWLLAVPGDGSDSIYLALGSATEENALTLDVLFGSDAALLWPDATLHKAAAMSNEYLAGAVRERYMQATEDLVPIAVLLLQGDRIPGVETLNKLDERISRAMAVTAELRRLHGALEIHRWNYDIAVDAQGLEGPVAAYHRRHMDSIIRRISGDLVQGQAALESANTALNSLRAKYERRYVEMEQVRLAQEKETATQQEKADFRTQTILAVVGVALAVGQVIDTDQELMVWRILGMVLAGSITALVMWYLVRRRD